MPTGGTNMAARAVIVWAVMLSGACNEEPVDDRPELAPTAHQVIVGERAIVDSFDPDVELGRAVAMDGDVAVVGVPRDDTLAGPTRAGLAYVHHRNQGSVGGWGVIKQLVASDPAAYDCFGRAVAIAGDVIAVGAHCKTTSTGAVYVFLRNQGGADNWGQAAKLTASDGQTYDRFGRALAIAGDVVAVGAPGYDERTLCVGAGCPSRPGSVYLFGRNVGAADAFGQIKKLQASDASATVADELGISLAISGDVLAVGAQRKASLAGAAYLFSRNAGGADQWGEIKKLVPATAQISCFGASIAIDGTRVAVGSPCEVNWTSDGAAYVFDRDQGGAGAWGQLKRITGSTITAADQFGDAIELIGDRLFVGANREGATQVGAAFVFERALGGADNWGEAARITIAGASGGDELGTALASDGTTLLVGAPRHDEVGADAGAVFVFGRDTGGAGAWGLATTVLPPTAVAQGVRDGRFGRSIAADGEWMVVGAYADYFVASGAGAAHVFRRSASAPEAWAPVAKLLPSIPTPNQYTGWSTAIAGTTIVLGAYWGGTGQAYVFELDAGTGRWRFAKRLVGSDAGASSAFGLSVAIDGDTIVVGSTAPGAAYVFERDLGGLGNWGERTKLVAADATTADRFGAAVAIAGDLIVSGSPAAAPGGLTRAGAAYVFARDQGGTDAWGEVHKLVAPDAVAYQEFGGALAIDGTTAVIGNSDSIFNGPERMQAYVYGKDVGGADAWGLVRKLEDADTIPGAAAGAVVAIDGELIVVGAPSTGPNGQGAAYVFSRQLGGADNWGLVQKIVGSGAAAGDQFGRGVDVAADHVFAGAPGRAVGMTSNVGAAYVFSTADPCLPDPCLHGGSCEVVGTTATCACPATYSGAACETDVDECALGTHTCSTDATCTNADGGFTCACKAGFVGDGAQCDAMAIDDSAADDGCGCRTARVDAGWLVIAFLGLARRRRRPCSCSRRSQRTARDACRVCIRCVKRPRGSLLRS